ncbi:hypothetical protein [Brevibacterium yomogidense]|uniref:hypothetical protein n=1 Tax=Brevibacterium yomogidense TaxID=946573 RepID=UPI0018DF4F14|nr:hypothetical protein [Brevibacterium yomogidense]
MPSVLLPLPRRRPTLLGTAVCTALSAVVLTTGCQVVDGERPVETPSVSPEDVTAVPTPSDLDVAPVIDVSPGGPQETDHVWRGLSEAAEAGTHAYVHAWVHTYQDVPDDGEATLTPDTPDSVSITVDDASAITEGQSGFYLLDATVEVEQLGASAFSLTVLDTDTRSELLPKGPDDKGRCQSNDANERIQAASQTLADVIREDDAEQREQLRLQWGASPAVWWGIQRTALTLADSDGDAAGDFLFEACEPYLSDEDDTSEDGSADDSSDTDATDDGSTDDEDGSGDEQGSLTDG